MLGAKVQQQGSWVWRGLFPVKDKSTLSPHPECLLARHSHTKQWEIHSWGSSARCLLSQTPDYTSCSCQAADPALGHSTPREWRSNTHHQFIPASSSQFIPASSSLLPRELAVSIQRLNSPDMSTYPIPLSLISMMWINTHTHTSSAPRAKGTSHQER